MHRGSFFSYLFFVFNIFIYLTMRLQNTMEWMFYSVRVGKLVIDFIDNFMVNWNSMTDGKFNNSFNVYFTILFQLYYNTAPSPTDKKILSFFSKLSSFEIFYSNKHQIWMTFICIHKTPIYRKISIQCN